MFNFREHLLQLTITYREAVKIDDFYKETLVVGRAEQSSLRDTFRHFALLLNISTIKNSESKRFTDTVENLRRAYSPRVPFQGTLHEYV